MALLLVLLTSGCPAFADLRVSDENPWYWQYQGRPILLIGGSDEDNLFQFRKLETHLDLLAAAGGNYVRNTMSSRDPGDLMPFMRDSLGFDLAQPNHAYWDRLEDLLRMARERGVIVQIEIWDRFDFVREPWLDNPFNPRNNVNYTAEEIGLADRYPLHPNRQENPFFRAVPSLDDNRPLLRYQKDYVDRLLSISLRFDNVLYCISNETRGAEEWSRYWAEYVRNAARAAGVEVQVTEMWDPHDLADSMHTRTFDHPQLYDFVEVSQNNHRTGDEHWDSLLSARQRLMHNPRPMNNVKIYGADSGPYGSTADALDRYWRNVLGGAASVRFHRPPYGLGLSRLVMAHLISTRMVMEVIDHSEMAPSSGLRERSPNEAYLAAGEGQFVLYFPSDGNVSLHLPAGRREWSGRWLRPDEARWEGEWFPIPSGSMTAATPDRGRWLLLIRVAPEAQSLRSNGSGD
jgi:hypothetical protein